MRRWWPTRIGGRTVAGISGRRHALLRLDEDVPYVICGNVDGVCYASDAEHSLENMRLESNGRWAVYRPP
jgi:hypothetical protein